METTEPNIYRLPPNRKCTEPNWLKNAIEPKKKFNNKFIISPRNMISKKITWNVEITYYTLT